MKNLPQNLSVIDHQKDRNWFTWAIIIVSIITYSFHRDIDLFFNNDGLAWFYGNAFFIWLMSIQILLLTKKKAISFILFGFSSGNLYDELIMLPTRTETSEYIFALIILLISFSIWKRYDRKRWV